MYRKNTLKQKLAAGKSVIGCWLHTASADAAEILSHAGFDFLLIDHEHGQATLTEAIAQMRAAQATDTTMLMRVPWNDPIYLKRALDAGVEGVMIPMVESAEAARAAVAACRYPPAGIRGAAGIVRAANYGAAEDYFDGADENLLITCQIESAGAVERIAEIGAVEGVDVLFIGPRDLSGSLGVPGRYDDPGFQAVLRRAEERILATGKILGTISGSAAETKALLARGYRMILPTSETTLLQAGAKALLKEIGSGR